MPQVQSADGSIPWVMAYKIVGLYDITWIFTSLHLLFGHKFDLKLFTYDWPTLQGLMSDPDEPFLPFRSFYLTAWTNDWNPAAWYGKRFADYLSAQEDSYYVRPADAVDPEDPWQ